MLNVDELGVLGTAQAVGLDSADLDSFCDRYAHGFCYELAVAIHERTGWPLKLLVERNSLVHAVVVAPGDLYVDACGVYDDVADIEGRYRVARHRWLDKPEDFSQVISDGYSRHDEMEQARETLATPWMEMVLQAAGYVHSVRVHSSRMP